MRLILSVSQAAEVQVLADDVVEGRDLGGDGGGRRVLVEGERPVVHDGLVVVGGVLVRDEVVVVLVEVVLHSCGENDARNKTLLVVQGVMI